MFSPPPSARSSGPRRRWSRWLVAVAAFLVVVGAAVVLLRWPPSSVAAGPSMVTVEGGWGLEYEGGAFDDGDAPELVVNQRADDFLAAFGLSNGKVLSVTSAGQPRRPVEVVLPYAPGDVPDGAVPAVFYFDTETTLWIPVQTRADPAGGRLIGTTTHFTDFTAALLGGLEKGVYGAAAATDWFAYQVAGITEARVQEPECSDPPTWVEQVSSSADPAFPRQAPLFACAESVADHPDTLRLRVAVNRAYGFEITVAPAVSKAGLEPSAHIDAALADVFSQRVREASGRMIAPATSTLVLEVPRGEATSVRVDGAWSPATYQLDLLVALFDVGALFATGRTTEKVAAGECFVSGLEAAGDLNQREVFLGTWTKGVDDCLGPAAIATGSAALARMSAGLTLSLKLGQAGQSLMDRERDWLDPAWVEARLDPATATATTDDLVNSSGDPTVQAWWEDQTYPTGWESGDTVTFRAGRVDGCSDIDQACSFSIKAVEVQPDSTADDAAALILLYMHDGDGWPVGQTLMRARSRGEGVVLLSASDTMMGIREDRALCDADLRSTQDGGVDVNYSNCYDVSGTGTEQYALSGALLRVLP